MPVVLLERLPLPSLKTYTFISVSLLGFAVYYAHQTVTDISSEIQSATEEKNVSSPDIGVPPDPNTPVGNLTRTGYILGMVTTLSQEAWCVWTLINMAYCCLILIGKLIQKMVFGNLRVSEQQHIKDKFWNFMFYKFIFIFGVMNVQNMDEVLLWCAWFSVLGFQHLMVQLCKDRFEYLSFSANTPKWIHAKVLFLLFAVLAMVSCLSMVTFFIGYAAGLNVFGFMLAECILLMAKTMHVILRYAIHLVDLNTEGVWEKRVAYVYYSELVFELLCLSVDFIHHLHMLLYGNIFLSMASLVICMQLRYLFHEFQRRIKRHKNYLRVVNSMEARFPMATQEDIEVNSDSCAICWDKMETARKLPCNHLFHNTCLTSWLEQDTSCPTCRLSLSERPAPAQPAPNPAGPAGDNPVPPVPPPVNTTNHFFHFDGSRYVSWLPSFSVEVTHTHILGNMPQRVTQMQNSQLNNMASQVQEVFPHMPINTIIEDLRTTRSVELTLENIIDERVVAPTLPSRDEVSNVTEPSTSSANDTNEPAPSARALLRYSPLTGSEPSEEHNAEYMLTDTLQDISSDETSAESTSEASSVSPTIVEPPAVAGSRFSKSPDERESILERRKEALLNAARRRYISSHGTQNQDSGDSDSSTNDDLRRRREVIYQATQRRLNGSDNSL